MNYALHAFFYRFLIKCAGKKTKSSQTDVYMPHSTQLRTAQSKVNSQTRLVDTYKGQIEALESKLDELRRTLVEDAQYKDLYIDLLARP